MFIIYPIVVNSSLLCLVLLPLLVDEHTKYGYNISYCVFIFLSFIHHCMSVFYRIITNRVLKNLFEIELSSLERTVAENSVKKKYASGLKKTIWYALLAILPILFLDTTIIVSVLIPITMVAGTAWFAISLANMKQKFEAFGLELTSNLFEAFAISLGLLFTLSVFSLGAPFWQPLVADIHKARIWWKLISFFFGAVIIGNIVYKIFIGSIKYDINDAMLTGQNEVAEKFYRRALSVLHALSESLHSGKSLEVANYYIGVAFFEIFSYMENIEVVKEALPRLMDKANKLVKNPSMKKKDADTIAIELIKVFRSYCVNPHGHESNKSLKAIADELWCLHNNTDENQEMTDTRFAIVFQEIANLLEGQGETLFFVKKGE